MWWREKIKIQAKEDVKATKKYVENNSNFQNRKVMQLKNGESKTIPLDSTWNNC